MEWTSSYINVWFFPRNSIPAAVTGTNPTPAQFGKPTAIIAGACDIDSHFFDLGEFDQQTRRPFC
jgi:hypothetical protein